MKQIQEWLGHSDFSTTANIYAHLDSQSKQLSAATMEKALALPEISTEKRWQIKQLTLGINCIKDIQCITVHYT